MSRISIVPNLRVVRALRGQALTIDLGKEYTGGILKAWMKKHPDDTSHRSFDVLNDRYLFLPKAKAQDYYDNDTLELIEAIEGAWLFDVRFYPDGGDVNEEEVIWTGTIEFLLNITDSNSQEIIGSIENPATHTFVSLFDTPNAMGNPGQLLIVSESGNKLEFIEPNQIEGTVSKNLQVFDSLDLARQALGTGKLFLYSKNNFDGVSSPNSDSPGLT